MNNTQRHSKPGKPSLRLMVIAVLAMVILVGSNLRSAYFKIPKANLVVLDSSDEDGIPGSENQNQSPADSEEEDENDDKIEPVVFLSHQNLSFKKSYLIFQDQLIQDPLRELVSPPPKI